MFLKVERSSILLLILLLLCFNGNAQEKRKYLYNIRLSYVPMDIPRYAKYPFVSYSPDIGLGKYFPETRHNVFRADVNYNIFTWFEVGVWGGYAKVRSRVAPLGIKTNVFLGGVKVSTHILPLFFEELREKSSRLDLYVSSEIGGVYFKNPDYGTWGAGSDGGSIFVTGERVSGGNAMKLTATIGGGAFFYFTRRMGIYLECQYGSFLTKKTFEDTRALFVPKIGLTFRF